MSSADAHGRRGEGGFTLLEVMCAFAILSVLTGFLTQIFFNAMEHGTEAFHLREVREAGDTIFRRMIYEEHQFHDGDTQTLDESYAQWRWNHQAPASERVKWERYRHVLEKKRVTAAGPTDQDRDEESLFEPRDSDDDDSGSRMDAESGPPGESLWKMTLRIYDVDQVSEDKALITLRTYIPVRETAETTRR